MAERILLGNLKGPEGPEGPQGPQGDPGGFNGESIGVNNLIDLTELTTYDTSSSIEIDTENGIINYSNAAYYIRQTRQLNAGPHSFRVKDYTSNADAFGGKIRFEVNDPETNNRVIIQDIEKDETVTFNVESSTIYDINIRVAGATRLNGFIEKPMLVEGSYLSEWSPSVKDQSYNNDYMRGRLLPDGDMVAGENKPFRVYSLDINNLETNDNSVTLKAGVYLFSSRHSLSFGGKENTLNFAIFQNDDVIARFKCNADDTLSTTQIIKARNGDTLTFEYFFSGEIGPSTQFQISNRNEFSIVKL